jgi:hypothetical protein
MPSDRSVPGSEDSGQRLAIKLIACRFNEMGVRPICRCRGEASVTSARELLNFSALVKKLGAIATPFGAWG